MKKLIVAIIAIFYISTTTGATVHMHYCMNKLVDVGFLHMDDGKCGKCGMEKANERQAKGCCKDEQKQIKLEKDQKTAEAVFQLMQVMAVDLPASFMEAPAVHLSSVAEENPVSHAPPRSNGVAVYIRNCVFLI